MIRTAAVIGLCTTSLAHAADVPAPVNYEDHIKPIFRQYCLKCHGEDEQKADLSLHTFEAVLKGGSGGKAVVPGRASASLLYQAITSEDADARMPPRRPPLPEAELRFIQTWINEGLRASAGAQSLTKSRDLSFDPPQSALSPRNIPATMPENLPAVNAPSVAHKLPVLGLDASPGAPLVAVARFEYVELWNTRSHQVLGGLPFPEGVPHVIRFSRDGAVLLVAGGKPVHSGKAVLFDVRSGRRLAEIGDEIDAILAADLSPDQRQVAIGGSGKTVKVYETSSGQLQYKLTRHTDWITAVGFSPDGTKLVSADRSGGLHVWESQKGGILLNLAEHKASIHSLDWRSDSRLLATAGEDGLLVWWDTVDGWPAITKPNAHPSRPAEGVYRRASNGILDVSFDLRGDLLSAGRDKCVRLWSPDGQLTATFETKGTIPVTTRACYDGRTLICGDGTGQIHFWNAPASP